MAESRKKPAAGGNAKQRTRAKSTRAKAPSAAAKKAADAAAEAAKAGGGASGGKPKSAAARVLRDSAIMARHRTGALNADIARELNTTTRTVERTIREFRALPQQLLNIDPITIVEQLLESYGRSAADFEALAYAWADTNASAALGAKRSAMDALAMQTELLVDVGKLPSNLETFSGEIQLVQVAKEMYRLLTDLESGDATIDFVRGRFEQMMDRRQIAGTLPRELEPGPE